jgi:predicted lipid-binding transport protein (Tim44 family)
MFKNFRDKIAISGITVLAIGVSLLIFTFFSAYGLLTADLSPISTQDLIRTFGEALGPLIAAAIHIMYLGVMGWVSSLITIRGVTIITQAPKVDTAVPQTPQAPQPNQQLQPQQAKQEKEEKQKIKPETKPAEPEMIVIPLEQMEQQPQPQPKRSS